MRKEPIDRFMEKVRLDESGCGLWTSVTTWANYGRFKVNGRFVQAHRWAYEYFKGPIPPGLQLDHLCRNRNCVNPAHLEPVTNRENLLRGDTLSARNTAKTHCPQGHPYAGDNLYIDPFGKRQCRTCVAYRNRLYYAHRKTQKTAQTQ